MSVKIGISFLLMLFVQIISAQQFNTENLVWPKPPQKERIKFLYSFAGEKNLGVEKSFFKKALDFFFGDEEKNNSFERPQGITVDNKGRILVSDIGLKGIHIFDFNEKEYRFIKEYDDSLLVTPIGITVADNDNIYVCDSAIPAILVFDEDLKYINRIHIDLIRPTAVKINKQILYITDTGASQIIVYDLAANKEKFRFGKRGNDTGEFNYPVHLNISAPSNDSTIQKIFVIDALNFRIQVFNLTGKSINSFGRAGNSVGDFGRPKGIALDSENHVYIADALFDVIQIFDQDGQMLLAFGGSGDKSGNFYLPTDIFIDKNDRIYVVDSGNRRVQVFQYLR